MMARQRTKNMDSGLPYRADRIGKTGFVSLWIKYRTMKQWRRATRLGKLLGMTQDEVLAEALRLGLRSLIRDCDKQSIDWRSVTDDARSDQAIRRELGESPPPRPMPDTGHPEDYVPPMIDD